MRNGRMSSQISLVLVGALATQYGCSSDASMAGTAQCKASTGATAAGTGTSNCSSTRIVRTGGWAWFGGGGTTTAPNASGAAAGKSSSWWGGASDGGSARSGFGSGSGSSSNSGFFSGFSS